MTNTDSLQVFRFRRGDTHMGIQYVSFMTDTAEKTNASYPITKPPSFKREGERSGSANDASETICAWSASVAKETATGQPSQAADATLSQLLRT